MPCLRRLWQPRGSGAVLSDQQAQELTPAEQEELNGALADYAGLIETRYDARLAEAMFRAGLAAARLPERPDNPRPGVRMMKRVLAETGICPTCSAKSASFTALRGDAADGQRADSSPGAEPSTPERPDEGITEEMVDAAARVIFDTTTSLAHKWGTIADPGRDLWRHNARVALEAAFAASRGDEK
jgi:hypothetical protein